MRLPSVPILPLLSLVATFSGVPIVQSAPRLSLWYRGQPAGVARAADLTAIRAVGFTAITWPAAQTDGIAEAARLASEAGLEFIVRPPPVALTPDGARRPDASVDIVAARVAPSGIAPLVWRAIAHGARDVSFDAGPTVEGILTRRGTPPAWSPAVGEISRHIRINGKLLTDATPAPDQPRPDQPRIDAPVPASVDIVLLSAGRAWVLVATNTGRRAHVSAHLPAGVPYAIWLNLLSGDTLAMLSEPAGPRWSFDLEAGGTRIYVIDKALR
jgi:hypothetical protein